MNDTESKGLVERQRVAVATENDMALVAAIHDAICTQRRPHGDCDVPDYDHTATHAAAAVLASDWFAARVAAARAEALREAERAIATSMTHNWTLRHDGTEDPIAAAYDDGQREACQIIDSLLRAAVADPEPQEPPNTCPSCALGQHRCTRDLAPCDCRECA